MSRLSYHQYVNAHTIPNAYFVLVHRFWCNTETWFSSCNEITTYNTMRKITMK